MAGLIGATGATDAGANADAMSQRWGMWGGEGRERGQYHGGGHAIHMQTFEPLLR